MNVNIKIQIQISQMIGRKVINLMRMMNKKASLQQSQRQKKISIEVSSFLQKNYQKLYSYEIVSIYHYLFTHSSKELYDVVDPILFQKIPHIFNVSFILSYLRLLCQIAYDHPYDAWSKQVRDLLHMNQCSGTDYSYLIRISLSRIYHPSESLTVLKKDIFQLMKEDIKNIDLTSLISIRRLIEKIIGQTDSVKDVKQMIDERIQKTCKEFNQYEVKSLALSHNKRDHWLFSYTLKSRNPVWKREAFNILFKDCDYPWKQYALDKYGEEGIIDQLPRSNLSTVEDYSQINRFLFEFNSLGSIISSHLEFQKTPEGKKLKNPQKFFLFFIDNLFNVLFVGHRQETSSLQEMNYIIQSAINDQNVKLSLLGWYKVLAVKIYIHYYGIEDAAKRIEQNLSIVKRLSQIVQSDRVEQIKSFEVFSFLKKIKVIGSVDITVAKTPEFMHLYNKFCQFNEEWMMKNQFRILIPLKINQTFSTVFSEYNSTQSDHREKNNQIIFGKYTPFNIQGVSQQVYMAKEVEVNGITMVDRLIKMKGENGEKMILVDLIQNSEEHEEQEKSRQQKIKQKLPIKLFWKKNYLEDWCKLNFLVVPSESALIQYIKNIAH